MRNLHDEDVESLYVSDTLMKYYKSLIRDFSLVGCGHTFCQSCLRDWFDTTYTKHIQQHPEFLTGPVIPAYMHQHRNHPQIMEEIRRIQRENKRVTPQPAYTCPACRAPAKAKPVEMFAFKEVVHKVAKAAGENVPEAPAQNRAARPDIGGVWDGFFKS